MTVSSTARVFSSFCMRNYTLTHTLTHTLHYITLEKIRLRQLIILILVVYKNVVEHTLWYMMMSLFNYINTLTSLSHSHVLLSWMWYLLLGEKLLLICNIFSVSWTDRPLCWLTYLYYPNWSEPGWSESNFFPGWFCDIEIFIRFLVLNWIFSEVLSREDCPIGWAVPAADNTQYKTVLTFCRLSTDFDRDRQLNSSSSR